MKLLPLALLAVAVNVFAQVSLSQPPPPVETNEHEETYSRPVSKTFSGSYLVYLPDHYAESPQQNWPVLLYLHSYDARGENCQKLKQEGLPYVIRMGRKLPFIVVAPLCPLDDWWNSRWEVENVNALLDEILEKYRADSKRVYLTGWSMGGSGVWRLASSYPNRFAAVAPISGRTQLMYAASLRNTPLWVFHGADDKTVPVSESQKMVDELKKLGSPVQFTIFPNTDHDAWQQVYSNSDFYDWLLKNSE